MHEKAKSGRIKSVCALGEPTDCILQMFEKEKQFNFLLTSKNKQNTFDEKNIREKGKGYIHP
jgi:hypothetical protein